MITLKQCLKPQTFILLLIKALAKGQTPPSSIVRSAKMGYQLIPLLMPVVLIYFLI